MNGGVSLLLAAALLLPILMLAPAAGESGARDGVTWSAASTGLPTNNNYYGVAFGDFNNDGNLDVVGAAESTGLKVYLGNGTGGWTAVASQPAAGGGFNDVRVGDINNDGNNDIVAGSTGIKVYRGNGQGGFTDISSSSGLPASDNWRGIALGDANKDGNLDIAATSGWGSTGGIRVWTGDGTGKFQANSSGLPGSQDRDCGIVLADFDKDGDLDLAAGGSPGVACYLGNGGAGGAMSWSSSSTGLPSGRFSGVNACDFNNDGLMDIILSAYNAGSGAGLRAMKNVNNAASWTSASTGLNASGDYLDISSGDFDCDGNLDILAAGSYGSSYGIHVFYGNGSGGWTWNASNLPRGYRWVGSDVGDFNKDGAPDFVIGSYSGRGISVYRNLHNAPPLPPVPLLGLREPLGGASWSGGSVHVIGWNATNGTAPYNLSLGYTLNGQPTVYPIAGPLFQADNGTGSHEWTVPYFNSTTVRVVVDITDSRNQTASNTSPADLEIDSSAPTAVLLLPRDGAQEVSNATVVRLRFSEPMNRSSAAGAVSVSGPGSPSLSSPTWNSNELTFQTFGLLMGERYDLTVSTGALDDSDPGNPLAREFHFSFNTSAAPVPSVTLNQPIGGEVWVAGTLRDILWVASGGTSELRMRLEYSTAGPNGTWSPVAENETNDGIYEWAVPDTPSNNSFVRATVTDSFSPPKSASDLCDSPFTIKEAPVPLSVNLTSPNGGEVWQGGTVQNITWNSTGGNGERRVGLEYSTEGSAGPWTDIARNLTDDGIHPWTVPETPSAACRVRITVQDSYSPPQTARDLSEDAFTIKAVPQPLNLTLESPTGGENWTVGTLHNIAWTASGGVAPLSVSLEYTTQGPDGPWVPIAAGLGNGGSYAWTVPNTTSEECHVRITVFDRDDPPRNLSTWNGNPFTISRPHADTVPPTVEISVPAEGAVLSGVVRVQLSAADNVKVTRIELLIDGASLANFTTSPGATDWDTTLYANGPHNLTARAWDAAGNLGHSGIITVTVKNSRPDTPGGEGFLEKYGIVAVVMVVLAAAVLLVALIMSRRRAGPKA